jgi:hypothetical protein
MALNYIPISSNADLKAALKQINENFRDIAAENQTKTVSQSGGNALQWGKLSSGQYGILISDGNNCPRIFIGIKKNGQPNISVSKSGVNVDSALGNV